jgi:hypothetical protein
MGGALNGFAQRRKEKEGAKDMRAPQANLSNVGVEFWYGFAESATSSRLPSLCAFVRTPFLGGAA